MGVHLGKAGGADSTPSASPPVREEAIESDAPSGEVLYNGIVLPEEWPPHIDPGDLAPMPVPYLEHRPDVVPIDVGRQLFVDDFLVEHSCLSRAFHQPVKYHGNPVLTPETEMEINEVRSSPGLRHGKPGTAAATPKSGGVWWVPEDQVFRMWYEAGWINCLAMAVSADGLHWERPNLGVTEGTNQVEPVDLAPDSWTVVRDWNTDDPDARWTLFVYARSDRDRERRERGGRDWRRGFSFVSPDGIHWSRKTETGPLGDRSTHFYNPFRKKWIYSLRWGFPGRGRTRAYYESEDFLVEPAWRREDLAPWLAADRKDPMDPETQQEPQLYNFDAVAYESILLGLYQIHHGPPNQECVAVGLPKITELNFAYSRDGFHWDRPDRRIQIPASRRDVWDRAYIQSVGGIAAIIGDTLYIYYVGFQGNPEKVPGNLTTSGMYDRGATGVALLRRDGFASMEAGARPGTLTTRPVVFSGRRLFVNAKVPNGQIRVEVRDRENNPIPPFTLENSIPFTGDSTLQELSWNGRPDLGRLAGQEVRFHFVLAGGGIYSFWVSRDESGRSDGYVAAGGPGYAGPTDTVGKQALKAATRLPHRARIE